MIDPSPWWAVERRANHGECVDTGGHALVHTQKKAVVAQRALPVLEDTRDSRRSPFEGQAHKGRATGLGALRSTRRVGQALGAGGGVPIDEYRETLGLARSQLHRREIKDVEGFDRGCDRPYKNCEEHDSGDRQREADRSEWIPFHCCFLSLLPGKLMATWGLPPSSAPTLALRLWGHGQRDGDRRARRTRTGRSPLVTSSLGPRAA